MPSRRLSEKAWFRWLRFWLAWFEGFPIFVGERAAKVAEFAGALQEFSAVHADDFAVDVGGAVAHQKGGEVGQLFDCAEAVEGIAVESQGLEFSPRQQAGECALRGDGAGRDGVHADAAVAPLHRETAGEGFDSGFGNGGGDYIS